ncbi:MAG: DUF4347 domain-containing protein, partial [Burkholderiaceae bacterium]
MHRKGKLVSWLLRRRRAASPPPSLIVEAMEPRVLFSADLAPALDETPYHSAYVQAESDSGQLASNSLTTQSQTSDQSTTPRRELIVVDAGVQDAELLVEQLQAGATQGRQFSVLFIESDTDGISQISDYLDNGTGFDAVHILSHGQAGEVTLGNTSLNAASVHQRADELAGWSDALSPDADLLFYGCDLAANLSGVDLINEIAAITGADVAASDDLTGAQSLGGDWELEISTGTIETALALSESIQKDFAGVLATFVVNNTGDTGVGSLRDAITNANLTAGADVIQFAITDPLVGGAHTISITSALPNITETVFIDGTSEPDYAGAPVIVLRSGGGSSNGLVITATADNSEVRGLVIRNFSDAGISINSGANGVTIAGNYIGSLDVNGNDAGASEQNNLSGIWLQGANATIGGSNPADRNIISGNGSFGIRIDGAGATGNTIAGNYIGVAADGNTVLPNTGDGILLLNSTTGNTIGGTGAGAGNVIVSNPSTFADGIEISGAPNNTVQGNRIGVSADGSQNLGTGGDGIHINSSSDFSIIGGAGSAGNWIAGSGFVGIEADGTSTGTIIQGNRIGTDATGTLNWGPQQNGILLENGASNSLIGGTAGEGNIIAFSGQGGSFTDAIDLSGMTSQDNAILGNTVYSNAGLGISLGTPGTPTPNDANDTDNGSNGLQNYPVLFTADINTSTIDITGSLNSQSNTSYRIEFFSNPLGSEDPTGHGEAINYLDFVNVTTNGSGNASINTTINATGVAVNDRVTATATVDLGGGNYGSTSEFSLNLPASSVNDDPIIAFGEGTNTFTEGGAAILIDSLATVSDVDSVNFDSGQLLVDVPVNGQGSDFIEIRHQGFGAGQIGVSGSTVSYGGVNIGSVSGSGAPMAVTFNANADATAVQAVMRNVTFRSSAVDPTTVDRTVRFRLSDGDSGNATAITKTVSVAGDATLVVTTTAFVADGDTSSVNALLANRGADGEIGLQEAIDATNNTAGLNTIHFNITDPLVGGAHTFVLGAQ